MRAAAVARSAERLGAAVGQSLSYASDVSEQEQVLQLAAPVDLAEAEAIAQQIAAQPGVEYAVPDQLRHALLTPDATVPDPRQQRAKHFIDQLQRPVINSQVVRGSAAARFKNC